MTNPDIIPIKSHREYERRVKRTAAGVLANAKQRKPVRVLVIGETDDDYFVIGSPPDPDSAMWLMEWAKLRLMGVV